MQIVFNVSIKAGIAQLEMSQNTHCGFESIWFSTSQPIYFPVLSPAMFCFFFHQD
jgi:hypothetical protein